MVHYDDDMDVGSDIDPEEEEKLDDALKEVLKAVPGCTVDTQTIKDMLWDSYYDVDAAIAYCVDKTVKAQKVKEMKREQAEQKMMRAKAAETAKASAKSFSGPSPDDIVLAKQNQTKIGGLASGLGNLNIAPSPAKTPDFSKWKPKIQPQDSSVTAIEPSLNAVAVGHVDAGKSTLLGRLLHDTGVVSSHVVEKLAKSASEIGKKSFSYAWLMDQTDEERENGVTVDISVREFSYESREYFILDAPGHHNFVPNMIAGASQADVAIVVLDSLADAFERGFFADGQTKEHALLCRAMGVSHVIIAVNKMDQIKFSQSRFDEISDQMGLFLSKIGYSNVQFVPCSGFTGANIVQKHDISWYHDSTIMKTLQGVPSAVGSIDSPLKIDIFNVKSSFGGVTVSGRLFSGMVQIDQPVIISPGGQIAIVRNIGVDLGSRNFAKSGENVNLSLEAVDGDLELVKAGDILAQYSDPVKRGNKFRARVTLFDVELPVLKGTQCDFYRSRVSSVAVFSKLYSLLDKQGNSIKDKPRFMDKGQSALVELVLSDIIALELEKNNKHLSRFVLRRDGQTIGFGSVVKVARNPVDTSQVERIQIGEDVSGEDEEGFGL